MPITAHGVNIMNTTLVSCNIRVIRSVLIDSTLYCVYRHLSRFTASPLDCVRVFETHGGVVPCSAVDRQQTPMPCNRVAPCSQQMRARRAAGYRPLTTQDIAAGPAGQAGDALSAYGQPFIALFLNSDDRSAGSTGWSLLAPKRDTDATERLSKPWTDSKQGPCPLSRFFAQPRHGLVQFSWSNAR